MTPSLYVQGLSPAFVLHLRLALPEGCECVRQRAYRRAKRAGESAATCPVPERTDVDVDPRVLVHHG